MADTPSSAPSIDRKGEEVAQVEYSGDGVKQSFGHKVKRHCVRFWWLHLVTFCVIFLIVALCLVYVGMPKIAQKGVDDSSLEFTELEFLNPTETSLHLSQGSILHSPSIFTPMLDSFNASLYLVTGGVQASEPIMNITLPKIHALHPKSNVSFDDQLVTFSNLDQVTAYTAAVLGGENVTTKLVGKTKLHLGKLPSVNINYHSVSTYKGLNSLAGFNVTDVFINLTAPDGTPNLSGNAFIPNPSIMTIEMGNVTFSMSTAKEGVVGSATVQNLTLKPGNNSLPLTGTMNQTGVLLSVDSNGYVDLGITGQSAIYNGQHLTYYEAALGGTVLNLSMNVNQVLKDSAKGSA